jgi:hypothetical protein
MTTKQFKTGLQSEITQAGFIQKIKTVSELSAVHNYKTAIDFDKVIDLKLKNWLNDRFLHGVTISDGDDKRAIINAPNEGVKNSAGTLVTITNGALMNAVGSIIDANTVFIFGSGNFKFTSKDYRDAEPVEVMNVLLRNAMITGIEMQKFTGLNMLPGNAMIINTNVGYDLRIENNKIFLMHKTPGKPKEMVISANCDWFSRTNESINFPG